VAPLRRRSYRVVLVVDPARENDVRALAREHDVPLWTSARSAEIFSRSRRFSHRRSPGSRTGQTRGARPCAWEGGLDVRHRRHLESRASRSDRGARLAFFALYALQHRGQESAGIAATDGRDMRIVRRMGLVGQVFSENDLACSGTRGSDTRVSTTGSSRSRTAADGRARPRSSGARDRHNATHQRARIRVRDKGVPSRPPSDTEVIAQMIAREDGATWERSSLARPAQAAGCWSLVILTRPRSTPCAIRSACGRSALAGRAMPGSWRAETCALETVGARFIRDVAPGEVLRIDDRVRSRAPTSPRAPRSLRVRARVPRFGRERPEGVSVYASRSGWATLATSIRSRPDVVIRCPTARSPPRRCAARRIRFREASITDQVHRRRSSSPRRSCAVKASRSIVHAAPRCLDGKRVIGPWTTDRAGSTSGPIVELIRAHGATRSTCAVLAAHPASVLLRRRHARRDDLIASRMDIESIRKHIRSGFARLPFARRMVTADGARTGELCTACFTGDYLVPVQLELAKDSLEPSR